MRFATGTAAALTAAMLIGGGMAQARPAQSSTIKIILRWSGSVLTPKKAPYLTLSPSFRVHGPFTMVLTVAPIDANKAAHVDGLSVEFLKGPPGFTSLISPIDVPPYTQPLKEAGYLSHADCSGGCRFSMLNPANARWTMIVAQ